VNKLIAYIPFKAVFFSSVIGLTACGGGDSDNAENIIATSTETDNSIEAETCINEQYVISSASDDNNYQDSYSPLLSIDGDVNNDSRWSSEGVGKEIIFDLAAIKTLSALQIMWLKGDERASSFSLDYSADNVTWTNLLSNQSSSGNTAAFEVINLNNSIETRYFKIIGLGNTENDWNSIIEVQAYKCELDAVIEIDTQEENETTDVDIVESVILPTATGIDLQDWYLSIPTDTNNNGYSDSIYENDLVNNYSDDNYFYGIEEVDGDKGIVMKSPSRGFRTSENTYYTRVELREMLRRGGSASTQGVNKNNWVFSSAPSTSQANAGGVDGELNVTLAINHVTTTYGEDLSQVKEADQTKTKSQFQYQVGRVVIGQIHANDDEPIRLYYRKLPEHTKGSIYFYHEPRTGDEVLVEMIGTKNLNTEPSNGIALNEKFSYSINVTGNDLTVIISRDGMSDVEKTLDMAESGFDDEDQYQYFKVGVYHLNNTAADDDYVQATFYEIRNSHAGYSDSE